MKIEVIEIATLIIDNKVFSGIKRHFFYHISHNFKGLSNHALLL